MSFRCPNSFRTLIREPIQVAVGPARRLLITLITRTKFRQCDASHGQLIPRKNYIQSRSPLNRRDPLRFDRALLITYLLST